MRSIALACILFFGATTAARAQDSYGGDAAITYHWVRTNASPGNCGCFGMNGGGVSGSWNFGSQWALVTEISAETAANPLSTGKSLTTTSYLAGMRYRIRQPWMRGAHALQPFAQLLLGAGHAGGGLAGNGDGSYAFAIRIGGGIDLPVNSHIVVRIIQIDYDFTHFPNSSNDYQNNLLLGAGFVFRWSRQK
jgi:outer membrane immunogenic protein